MFNSISELLIKEIENLISPIINAYISDLFIDKEPQFLKYRTLNSQILVPQNLKYQTLGEQLHDVYIDAYKDVFELGLSQKTVKEIYRYPWFFQEYIKSKDASIVPKLIAMQTLKDRDANIAKGIKLTNFIALKRSPTITYIQTKHSIAFRRKFFNLKNLTIL
jgi:hypothetical protein